MRKESLTCVIDRERSEKVKMMKDLKEKIKIETKAWQSHGKFQFLQ